MYPAELHGKLPSKTERSEDILTSNVFSFFKYSKRNIFLKGYLNSLGFSISDQDAENAEFFFWPRFEDHTEPDLVIIAGCYYFLFEAKYFSDFSDGNQITAPQLLREIEGGKYEAKNNKKEFILIVINRDHYYRKERFRIIPRELMSHFKWTNWQTVSFFLNTILNGNINLNKQERTFALDLYNLLDKKNLRGYQSITQILKEFNFASKQKESIFFEAKTAKYRGDFIGFLSSLSYNKKIDTKDGGIFFNKNNSLKSKNKQTKKLSYFSYFDSLDGFKTLDYDISHIFFKGGQ